MATIDLSEISGDQIVIHYGGALTSVDAYTFANSLISFADMVRTINQALNPEQPIDIRVDAIGPGSSSRYQKTSERLRWILLAQH